MSWIVPVVLLVLGSPMSSSLYAEETNEEFSRRLQRANYFKPMTDNLLDLSLLAGVQVVWSDADTAHPPEQCRILRWTGTAAQGTSSAIRSLA